MNTRHFAYTLRMFNLYKKQVYSNKKSILNDALNGNITISDFYVLTQVLTPQSQGPIYEKYFCQSRGFTKTKNKNFGDFHDFKGNHYEYKFSGLNQGSLLHVVQIRPWQAITGYYIQKLVSEKLYTFYITKEHMKTECVKLKARPAHGTKQANANNENVELRFDMKVDSEDFKRWMKEYLVHETDILKID